MKTVTITVPAETAALIQMFFDEHSVCDTVNSLITVAIKPGSEIAEEVATVLQLASMANNITQANLDFYKSMANTEA